MSGQACFDPRISVVRAPTGNFLGISTWFAETWMRGIIPSRFLSQVWGKVEYRDIYNS
jgi:hypothetical protein